MSDWFEDNMGCLAGLFVLVLLAVVVIAVAKDNARERKACARAWSIARTSSDSIAVIRMCEVKETRVQPVPYPVYIPQSR